MNKLRRNIYLVIELNKLDFLLLVKVKKKKIKIIKSTQNLLIIFI